MTITKSALGENQESIRKNLHAGLVSTTARTVPTMIKAMITVAAKAPTKIFFIADDLQYQSRDL